MTDLMGMATAQMMEEQAAGTVQACIRELAPALPDAPARIVDFIRAAAQLGPQDHYKAFPAAAQKIATEVNATHGAATLRLFLRAVVASAVQQTVGTERYRTLPPLTAANQARHLLRIA
jgi:hypothetical protein